MLDRILTHSELLTLVDELSRQARLIGPVARDVPDAKPPRRYFYEPVEQAAQLDLDFNYCVFGPTRFLLPSHETLFVYQRHQGGFTAQPVFDEQPTALIGVHPCDLHALQSLDRAFYTPICDEHYQRRRENLFIVGIDCATPCTDGCFCADMRTNHATDGFDVMLYPFERGAGRRYGVLFGSDAGREWILYNQRGVRPTVADERTFDEYQRRKLAEFPLRLTTGYDDLPALLKRSYDSLLWEATARRCYSCGSCNTTCPTCYCFDVNDEPEITLASGRRTRVSDGCMLREFATVAGGHNFRPQAAARLRHRIYRKSVWIRERLGTSGCVGCARCDRACTAKINCVEIYNQLAEEV